MTTEIKPVAGVRPTNPTPQQKEILNQKAPSSPVPVPAAPARVLSNQPAPSNPRTSW